MISSAQFNKIRRKTLGDLLIPLGYVENGADYVLQRNHQIFCIDFQKSKYGGEFAINLCFQYDFVPSYHDFIIKEACKFKQEDFCLWCRLDQLTQFKDFHSYGDSDAECRNKLIQLSNASVEILDECTLRWSSPEVFLKMLPPELIHERVEWVRYIETCELTAETRMQIYKERFSGLEPGVLKFLNTWGWSIVRIIVLLIYSALHVGNRPLALEYVNEGMLLDPRHAPMKSDLLKLSSTLKGA